jgi:hypothetical protein
MLCLARLPVMCSMLQCGNKLLRTMNGPMHTVFAHALRGLSAAKITRAKTETYTNHAGGSLGVVAPAPCNENGLSAIAQTSSTALCAYNLCWPVALLQLQTHT